ncbi:MAG: tRNA-intron lyase [Candidatus Nitrosopolaris sp.]|jgi:tRNA-intron endonuclease
MPIQGVLVENRVIVWNIEQSHVLFGNGYYGKPLGVPKPKGIEFDAPLILDLMEGCYLNQIGKLEISNYCGRTLSSRDILKICKKEYANFQIKYLVFKNLRDSGYIVSPGLKFGCDFAVYEEGPGIDHAPYLVQVSMPTDHMNATGIVLFGRLATTVKKQFILAIPRLKERKVDFVGFEWWRA